MREGRTGWTTSVRASLPSPSAGPGTYLEGFSVKACWAWVLEESKTQAWDFMFRVEGSHGVCGAGL